MKYLYGDSTESSLQRDFLGLLDNFIDTTVKAVTLENSVFKLNDDIRDRRKLKNSVLEEMDSFHSKVNEVISSAATDSKEQEIVRRYAEKSRHYLENFINEGKTDFSKEVLKEIEELEEKVNEINEESRETLESFLIKDPVTLVNKRFSIKATKTGYSAKVDVEYKSNIFCEYSIASSDLSFWKRHVRASSFLKGVRIPARMKKPIFKSENVPDNIILDNYYLTDLVVSGKKLEAVFRKTLDMESDRFRFKMDLTDDFSVDVFHADDKGVEKDIQMVPELKKDLDIFRMKELGNAIFSRMDDLYSKKSGLVAINIEGKDIFSGNLVFDLMERIAKIFAPTVNEIMEHTPSKEELSLKEEDETGKRKEIYLKKSQVKGNLSLIGEKGESLLGIFNIK